MSFERSAQIIRYYLKHQNYSSWNDLSDFQQGATVACQNLERAMLEEASQPSNAADGKRRCATVGCNDFVNPELRIHCDGCLGR